MDLKENFARNLLLFRKEMGITQSELAEKINYSDKAISKWERGESIPDIYVLKQIADLFCIKVDMLISEPRPELIKLKNLSKKRVIICLASTVLVWLIAILSFTSVNIIIPSIERSWMSFIYAIPISLVVLLSLTSVWGKTLANAIFSSLFAWTLLLSIFLSLLYLLPTPPENLWMVWFIGIPVQGLILFYFFYKKL